MTHPKGLVVDIINIEISDHGDLCEEHEICGSVLSHGQVLVKGIVFSFSIFDILALHTSSSRSICSHCVQSHFPLLHALHNLFPGQMRDARKEETAWAVYWVIDIADRCLVGFVLHDLIKHTDKCNGVLAQVTEIYSTADESKYRRQKI